MSREILFRAKFEGKWVYGYLFDVGNNVVVVYCPKDKMYYSCDAETVGQYTGFRDADGDKIWDGDIITDGDDRGVVSWDDNACRFVIDFDGYRSDFNGSWQDELTIIGNIHDNPEMVGVRK